MKNFLYATRPELRDQVKLAYCPERVLPGSILQELQNNDRVVGGIDEDSTEAAVAFYKRFVAGEILRTNAPTAELCKLAEKYIQRYMHCICERAFAYLRQVWSRCLGGYKTR
jgi:UDP-N-acetyl-D-mannosaminuronic acid dehydrogenase